MVNILLLLYPEYLKLKSRSNRLSILILRNFVGDKNSLCGPKQRKKWTGVVFQSQRTAGFSDCSKFDLVNIEKILPNCWRFGSFVKDVLTGEFDTDLLVEFKTHVCKATSKDPQSNSRKEEETPRKVNKFDELSATADSLTNSAQKDNVVMTAAIAPPAKRTTANPTTTIGPTVPANAQVASSVTANSKSTIRSMIKSRQSPVAKQQRASENRLKEETPEKRKVPSKTTSKRYLHEVARSGAGKERHRRRGAEQNQARPTREPPQKSLQPRQKQKKIDQAKQISADPSSSENEKQRCNDHEKQKGASESSEIDKCSTSSNPVKRRKKCIRPSDIQQLIEKEYSRLEHDDQAKSAFFEELKEFGLFEGSVPKFHPNRLRAFAETCRVQETPPQTSKLYNLCQSIRNKMERVESPLNTTRLELPIEESALGEEVNVSSKDQRKYTRKEKATRKRLLIPPKHRDGNKSNSKAKKDVR